MKRNNVQRGRYAKRRGAQQERRAAHTLSKWAQKSFGKTAQFGRTLSSGASANYFYEPNSDLLGDIFAVNVPNWNFSIECKAYKSSSLKRFYEGTTRLQSFLEENTRDARRHKHKAVPILDCHVQRFRDILILPYEKTFFLIMNSKGYSCWSTYESYTVKRTGHKFRFHVIMTDLQSLVKAMSCKKFIQIYQHCDWDCLNHKYTKKLTHTYLKNHSRKEMSTSLDKIVDHTLKHK